MGDPKIDNIKSISSREVFSSGRVVSRERSIKSASRRLKDKKIEWYSSQLPARFDYAKEKAPRIAAVIGNAYYSEIDGLNQLGRIAFQLVNSGEGEKIYGGIKYNVEKSGSGYKITFNKEGRLCSIIIDPSCNRRLVYEEYFKDSQGRINRRTKILNKEKKLTAQNVTVDIYTEIIDKDKIVLQNHANYYQNSRSKTILKRNEDLINRKEEKYYIYPNGCADKYIRRKNGSYDVVYFYNKEFALRAEILKKMMRGSYTDKDLNTILLGTSEYTIGFLNQLSQNNIKIEIIPKERLPHWWPKDGNGIPKGGAYYKVNYNGRGIYCLDESLNSINIPHEMAHAYDDIKFPDAVFSAKKFYSQTDPIFLNLYENYCQRVKSAINLPKLRVSIVWEEEALESIEEYFAYAVEYYLGTPSTRAELKQKDPKLYAYLKTLKIFKK